MAKQLGARSFLCILLVLLAVVQPGNALFFLRRFLSGLGQPQAVPPTPASVQDIAEMNFRERVHSFQRGAIQFITNRPECSTAAVRLVLGCAEQYAFIVESFGLPAFSPFVTPEKQTPEFLAQLPPPGARCCGAAHDFQSNLCGCDTQTIRAFRNLLLLDPEMTEIGTNYLYGDLCGAPVRAGDSCPNGNPFDRIRAEEASG